jgi:hypothetical protein
VIKITVPGLVPVLNVACGVTEAAAFGVSSL